MANRVAGQNGLHQIHRVVVAIGDFAGVEIHALEFAFQVLSKSTLAEGAELVIERVGILLRCGSCSCEYPAEIDDLACPVCGGEDYEVIHGRELTLRSIAGE
jgi:hydrogenase nickel incorporation protein HypA/HybF